MKPVLRDTMTAEMMRDVLNGATIAMTVRPRCKGRVRMMQADPVIGCFCLPMLEDGEQWTESRAVAAWLFEHPLCGIAVRIVDNADWPAF